MSAPKAPSAPDPVATTQAQAAANKEAVRESALVNQIGQVSPFGEVRFTGDIGTPSRTRTTTLPPVQQQALDQQNQLALLLSRFGNQFAPQVTGAFDEPLSFEGLPEVPNQNDLNAGATAVEDATFARAKGLLDPVFAEQARDLEGSLVNRGLPRSGEAFRDEIGDFRRSTNEAFENAAFDAVRAGRAERSRLVGEGLGLRNQGLSERLTARTQPINELAALLQGSPAINVPTFQPTAQFGVQPPDVIGANQLSQNAQLAAFNAANQRQQGLFGGLFDLGAAGLPLIF